MTFVRGEEIFLILRDNFVSDKWYTHVSKKEISLSLRGILQILFYFEGHLLRSFGKDYSCYVSIIL